MSDAEGGGHGEHDAHAGHEHGEHDHDGPGYATPQAAIEESEPEEVADVMGL